MSGHTKGPWVLNYDEYDGKVSVRSGNARDLADYPLYYEVVRSVGGRVHGANFDDYSEVEANARLIAAAPDLLEALEDLESDIAGRFDMEDPSTNPGIKFAIEAARAAIAKATGETK